MNEFERRVKAGELRRKLAEDKDIVKFERNMIEAERRMKADGTIREKLGGKRLEDVVIEKLNELKSIVTPNMEKIFFARMRDKEWTISYEAKTTEEEDKIYKKFEEKFSEMEILAEIFDNEFLSRIRYLDFDRIKRLAEQSKEYADNREEGLKKLIRKQEDTEQELEEVEIAEVDDEKTTRPEATSSKVEENRRKIVEQKRTTRVISADREKTAVENRYIKGEQLSKARDVIMNYSNCLVINGIPLYFEAGLRRSELDFPEQAEQLLQDRQRNINKQLINPNMSEDLCARYVSAILKDKGVRAELERIYSNRKGNKKKPEYSNSREIAYHVIDIFTGGLSPKIDWNDGFFRSVMADFRKAVAVHEREIMEAKNVIKYGEIGPDGKRIIKPEKKATNGTDSVKKVFDEPREKERIRTMSVEERIALGLSHQVVIFDPNTGKPIRVTDNIELEMEKEARNRQKEQGDER